MLPGGFFQSEVRHAKRGVEPCGRGECLSQGGARPWEVRSDVVAHGAERLVQLVFPDAQWSPDPYGGDPLPLGGLVDRRLRCARVARDLRHVHEAVGQVVRFGCRGGGRPRIPAPPFSRPSALLSDIPVGAGNASRGIRRMSPFTGWQNRPLVLHLVPSGRNEAQGVASSGRDEQRDACWEACAQSHAGR